MYKMTNKTTILILMLGILLLNFSSALECWGTFKQNTDIDLIQKCPSCSYVNITSITYPNGTVFLNDAMTQDGINFNYTLPDNSQLGIISYGTIGDKDGVSPPDYEDLCIEITATGEEQTISKAIIDISLLIFFILLMVGFYYIRNKIDFDKWYNGIFKKYKTKNFVKLALSAIGYNLMKNSFIIYYLIGFPIMLIVTSLAWSYNIVSSLELMKVLMYIYASGFLIVGAVFLSYLQEWSMDAIDKFKKMDWGLDGK